jgi:hypothetical protein
LRLLRLAALAAIAGIFILAAGCGSSSPAFNATPIIGFVFPAVVTAGSQSFTLFISGSDFKSDSGGATFAFWNGSPRSTNFNADTTELEVSISASDVATANTVQITLMNPPPGGGLSNSTSFAIVQAVNPQRTISSFSPASADAGGSAFALTVNGANFQPNDVVTWNGAFRSTTIVSSSKATAQITGADVSSAAFGSVSVLDSNSGVFGSPSVQYPVIGGSDPVPGISSLSPSSTAHGGIDFELVVHGSNFAPTSIVQWNGSDRATAFISDKILAAWIFASDITAAGSASVTVNTPATQVAPGGGTSGASTFTVQ